MPSDIGRLPIHILHTTHVLYALFIKSSNITGYWTVCHNRKYYIVVLRVVSGLRYVVIFVKSQLQIILESHNVIIFMNL